MEKRKFVKIITSGLIILSIMLSNLAFPMGAIAASLSNWRQEVRSYNSEYGFNVNGKYEPRWLFYDSIQPQIYKDLYCIRSGDRQNKEYIEEDLYNISTEEKNNLFENETNYKHLMWIVENMYLYGDTDSQKMSKFLNLIGASELPFADNDEVKNKLILQDGAKITGEIYTVKRNEQVIKAVQNEMLLQLVRQNYTRNTDLSKFYNSNVLVDSKTSNFVQKIINVLLKDSSKYSNYTVDNKNKNFGKANYDGYVKISATKAEDDATANWGEGLSAKFTVNNKYKATVTGVNVYINDSKLDASDYTILNMSGNDVTSVINNMLTGSASSQAYEFRIKYNGTTNDSDKIKVELNIDYGYITTAKLLKPKEKQSMIGGSLKNNQYMIDVSRNRKTDIVSTEQKEIVEKPMIFDLALTKEITNVKFPKGSLITKDRGYSRLNDIDLYNLKNGNSETARYIMDKTPVEIENNSVIKYKITVYNEGNVDGYAKILTDYLPEGLKLIDSQTSEINKKYGWVDNNDGTISTEYLADKKINAFNGSELDSNFVELECIADVVENVKTRMSSGERIELDNRVEITKYGYLDENNLFVEASAEKVDRDSIQNSVLKNANTTEVSILINQIKVKFQEAKNKAAMEHRYYTESKMDKALVAYQDDDDVERLIISSDARSFDLALRKWIIKVNDKELKDKDGKAEREPSQLEDLKNAIEPILKTYILRFGTLDYDNPKKAVEVNPGDLVTYRIAIFNEGDRNSYAEEITDYLPKGLEFVENNEINKNNGWVATKNADGTTIIKTDKLSKAKGKAINKEWSQYFNEKDTDNVLMDILEHILLKDLLSEKNNIVEIAKTVDVVCKVSTDVEDSTYLTNRAEITKYGYYEYNDVGEEIFIEAKVEGVDKDSVENTIKDDLNLENWYVEHYDEVNPQDTFAGVQDDDDFETVKVKVEEVKPEFDLALRKFITSVNGKELKGEDLREPQVDVEKLASGESTTAKYEHTKVPYLVSPKDIVEYTIRVYNEGEVAGYAKLVMDDIPEGVEMVKPEYDKDGKPLNTNAKYRWVMYKKSTSAEDKKSPEKLMEYDNVTYVITDNVEEAEFIVTDYLSKEVGGNDNLINAFDPARKTIDSRDLKVEFKVKATNEANKIITNSAQVTEDTDSEGNPVDDRDSTPNVWEKEPRNDDQDIENITVKYFDLALYKWVSTAYVTEDGKTVEYPTQHTQADKSNLVNVSIGNNELDKVIVKFKYIIKVENQGQLDGYAKEIKDHIPEGLKFVAEDNIEYGWVLEEDGTITTDYLKDTLLKHGETAEVAVVLTWINSENNLGLKVNYAEISKDYNDYDDSSDIDSTPDNFVKEVKEDDEDKDEVMLNIRTGSLDTMYIVLAIGVVTILATGIVGIKVFVLE